MSPERVLGEDARTKDDVWGLGIILHELATAEYPFDITSFPALFEGLVENPEPRLDSAIFPPTLCEFHAHCLTRDVCDRADIRELKLHDFLAIGVPSRDDFAAWLNGIQRA